MQRRVFIAASSTLKHCPFQTIGRAIVLTLIFVSGQFAASEQVVAERAASTSARDGTLVVFLGPPDTFSTKAVRDQMDAYRELCEDLNIAIDIRSISDGAPEEVVVTPLFVFQNDRGRSIYQGRVSTLDRLRNFIRTSRVIPQSSQRFVRTDSLIWSSGRSTVSAPVKLTRLGGEIPLDLDMNAFDEAARRSLDSGMSKFEHRASTEMGRGDRSFYLDVHPYASDGLLFLSCEIYSQFNCHTPIFSILDDPIIGFWDDRDALFEEAGMMFEEEIMRFMSGPDSIDAFAAVPLDIPTVSWSDLGLELPAAPVDGRGVQLAADFSLPTQWIVEDSDETTVFFRFAPPLDNYAGEAQSISGSLVLDEQSKAISDGVFRVPVSSVTMGDELLDSELQKAAFLDAEHHPQASFDVTTSSSQEGQFQFGEQTVVHMHGDFQMKGMSIPIEVRVSFEPLLDDNAMPLLHMRADWSIRIGEPFGMTGPDGPMPARDTVLFISSITLRPAGRIKENSQ